MIELYVYLIVIEIAPRSATLASTTISLRAKTRYFNFYLLYGDEETPFLFVSQDTSCLHFEEEKEAKQRERKSFTLFYFNFSDDYLKTVLIAQKKVRSS